MTTGGSSRRRKVVLSPLQPSVDRDAPECCTPLRSHGWNSALSPGLTPGQPMQLLSPLQEEQENSSVLPAHSRSRSDPDNSHDPDLVPTAPLVPTPREPAVQDSESVEWSESFFTPLQPAHRPIEPAAHATVPAQPQSAAAAPPPPDSLQWSPSMATPLASRHTTPNANGSDPLTIPTLPMTAPPPAPPAAEAGSKPQAESLEWSESMATPLQPRHQGSSTAAAEEHRPPPEEQLPPPEEQLPPPAMSPSLSWGESQAFDVAAPPSPSWSPPAGQPSNQDPDNTELSPVIGPSHRRPSSQDPDYSELSPVIESTRPLTPSHRPANEDPDDTERSPVIGPSHRRPSSQDPDYSELSPVIEPTRPLTPSHQPANQDPDDTELSPVIEPTRPLTPSRRPADQDPDDTECSPVVEPSRQSASAISPARSTIDPLEASPSSVPNSMWVDALRGSMELTSVDRPAPAVTPASPDSSSPPPPDPSPLQRAMPPSQPSCSPLLFSQPMLPDLPVAAQARKPFKPPTVTRQASAAASPPPARPAPAQPVSPESKHKESKRRMALLDQNITFWSRHPDGPASPSKPTFQSAAAVGQPRPRAPAPAAPQPAARVRAPERPAARPSASAASRLAAFDELMESGDLFDKAVPAKPAQAPLSSLASGFKTASDKPVILSEAAKKRAAAFQQALAAQDDLAVPSMGNQAPATTAVDHSAPNHNSGHPDLTVPDTSTRDTPMSAQAPMSSMGFKTAGNKPIAISAKAQQHAAEFKRLLEQEDDGGRQPLDQQPSTSFKTASNRPIVMSAEGQQRAAEFQRRLELDNCNSEQPSMPTLMGFKTAGNRPIAMSAEGQQRAAEFQRRLEQDNCNSEQPSMPTSMGFKTAGNRPIVMSAEGQQRAAEFQRRLELDNSSSDQSPLSSSMGFKTAGSKPIAMSAEAQQRAAEFQRRLELDNSSSDQSLLSSSMGFKTAGNKPIAMSAEAQQRAAEFQRRLEQDELNAQPAAATTPMGFRTAGNKSIAVSAEAQQRAADFQRRLLQEDDKASSGPPAAQGGFKTASNQALAFSPEAQQRAAEFQLKLQQADVPLDTTPMRPPMPARAARSTPQSSPMGRRRNTPFRPPRVTASPAPPPPPFNHQPQQTPQQVPQQSPSRPAHVSAPPLFAERTTAPRLALADLPAHHRRASAPAPPAAVLRAWQIISADNAAAFRWTQALLRALDVSVLHYGVDVGQVEPAADGSVGLEQIAAAFAACPAISRQHATDAWIANHFRWIVWKLAALARAFPGSPHAAGPTPLKVLQELHYRFHREYRLAHRSALAKVLQRDEFASRYMILCVAQVLDGATVVLTDGWYAVTASLDASLAALLARVIYERQ